MEDVIFAGNARAGPRSGGPRSPLTIDNTDGALPIDYTEVTISGTMFRNGDPTTPSTGPRRACSTSRNCSPTAASA